MTARYISREYGSNSDTGGWSVISFWSVWNEETL
jgi:hypothetical protein